ncbi:MAG: helix-turn-helix domain-containing protein [Pseudonocardiaceae bacterium]
MSSGSIDPHARRAGVVEPALFRRAEIRRVLAGLDIGALYRVLGTQAGLSQRQIAARTGQSQSEVSEIVAGHRRVESHPVLVRIARGLDIPRVHGPVLVGSRRHLLW